MTARRATSLAEFRDFRARAFTRDAAADGMRLVLRPTDVVITPFGKSGTTWTQQIVHTLRTRGDLDFDDISRVIPWIEVSPGLGLDLDAEQKANPRAFKSHLEWGAVPEGGRYINVVRRPGDVLVSNFKFMEGWFFEVGSIDLEAYARENFFERRGYYRHLRSWWPRRNDPDVLFLGYERMLKESERTIRRIAAFIGIEADEDLVALTLERSSIEFMLEHKDRFDDAMLRSDLEDRGLLPAGSDSAKVRVGKAGAEKTLSAAIQELLAEAWAEEIAGPLGFVDYDGLLDALE